MNPVRFLPAALAAALAVPALVCAQPAPAEPGSVEWLAQSFFTNPDWEERQQYYTGEMKLLGSRATPATTYPAAKYEATVRVNEQTDESAAASVSVRERAGNQRTDFYLFFRRVDGQWKLAAVRNFASPRGTGQMYAAVASKGQEVSANDLRELTILQSLQFNDWALKQIFEKHREDLQAIAAEFLRRSITEVVHGGQRNRKIDEKTWQKVHDLNLNYVQLQEPGWVEMNLASFGESAVGFLYVVPGVQPPHATPEDWILVEPLVENWYLYRRQ